MNKNTFYTVLGVVFLISLGGCAATNQQSQLEVQGLKNQVAVLQSRIQEKDAEIDSLRSNISSGNETSYRFAVKKTALGEIKTRPNVKQIQSSLKNAGYYKGAVDGQMGKQTREAIKSFQKDNKLTSDGRVGKQTWRILRKYLNDKAE